MLDKSVVRHLWRVLWPVLVFVFAQTLVAGVILLVLLVFHDFDRAWEIGSNIGMMLVALASAVSLLWWVPLWRRTANEHPKLNGGALRARPVVLTVALWLGVFLAFSVVMFDFVPREATASLVATLTSGALVWRILGMGILAPIVEELVFRGVILSRLSEWLSLRKSMWASSVLFGLIHLNPVQILSSTPAGFLFAWQYVKSRNIWLPIVGHMVFNLANVFLLHAYSLDPGSVAWLRPWVFVPAVVMVAVPVWVLGRSKGSHEI